MIGDAEIYVLARRTLLDALEALGDHRKAVILVGAQAVYLHTGEADLAVALHTTDADLALDPSRLADEPLLVELMKRSGFQAASDRVGTWTMHRTVDGEAVDIEVDLLVPEAVGGSGRRGARLGSHGNRAARKTRGIEGVLVDHVERAVTSLEPTMDMRSFDIRIAGPAALLVAKLHKIHERMSMPDRSQDKDALDVLRILRAVPTERLVEAFERLRGQAISAAVTSEARDFLPELFGKRTSPGSQMAARAVGGLEETEVVVGSVSVLAMELHGALR